MRSDEQVDGPRGGGPVPPHGHARRAGLPATRTDSSSDAQAAYASAAYIELLERLRRQIRESQGRTARVLNSELVVLYWSIGREII